LGFFIVIFITEFKELFYKHINKKMQTSKLKQTIREVIKKVLSEDPTVSPSTSNTNQMNEAPNREVYLKKLLKVNGFESVYKDIDQISPNDAAKVAQGMEIIVNNWDCSPNGAVIWDIIDYLKLKNNG
jgi:hypothetical protein